MAGEHILIVEDDARICRMLSRYLKAEGFSVVYCFRGDEVDSRIAQRLPDCVLLDLSLPDMHGFDLARRLRKENERLGIIIITGAGETVDRIIGLEVGADDYIPKPFNEREVLARLRSVLRRVAASSGGSEGGSDVIAFDEFELDLDAHQLLCSGKEVELTSHEFLLLSVLVKAGNRVLSRDQILEGLSGRDWYPSDRSVDVLIGKLRKKLNDTSAKLIKTIRGRGYKFAGKVS